MNPQTWTSTAILDGLSDPNNHALWAEFDARFRPVIEGVAMKMGLSRDEAADVAQQTLVEFAAAYKAGKYERGRGRLRSFLLGIARFRITDVMRARAKRRGQRGDSALQDRQAGTHFKPAEQALADAWEKARLKFILKAAMRELREKTRIDENNLAAFEMLVVKGLSPEQVSASCGMSVAQVYVIKTRVSARLREIVNRMKTEYEKDE
ncbi:MAG: sigma-70 family RNA polymerase sigma factor [Phycisphaerae bacterium]|nr:sigma-70 family RNA polymerase sigma factor [Phycisphaerae bacterium]